MGKLNTFFLFVIEVVSICSCTFGILKLSAGEVPIFALILYGNFYILGLTCNLCGLVATYYGYPDPEDDSDEVEEGTRSNSAASANYNFYIQYHYLLAWLTVVIGYPSVVVHSWMVHYDNVTAQLHFLLVIPPMICWVRKIPKEIAITTQVTGFLAVISHAYIEFLARDMVGVAGAGTMLLCLITIAVPTKHRILGLTAREFYLALLAASSYIFAYNIESDTNYPNRVSSLIPWADDDYY